MRGEVAFRKLERLAAPDELERVFLDLNWGAKSDDKVDITSCFVTATAVTKTLTNQEIAKSGMASVVSGGTPLVRSGQSNVQQKEIMKHLDRDCLVWVSLVFKKDDPKDKTGGGDHHFAVFRLDKDTVVAAMGWQNKYDLTKWFRENDGGRFQRATFEKLMGKIEDGTGAAVAELCSFLGTTKDGRGIPQALEQELSGYRGASQAVAFALPES